MSIIVQKDEQHIVYESIEEYEEAVAKYVPTYNAALYAEHMRRDNSGYGGGMFGFGSYDNGHWFGEGIKNAAHAMQKIKNGWPEMLDKLRAMWGNNRPELQLAISTVKVRRRKRHRTDYGDTLDIHRVWSGELDKAWERPQREYRLSATQRHATIYIDLAANAHVSAESTLWRAAAALLICDILIATGRAVEIYVGDSTIGGYEVGPRKTWTAMRVKSYGQPLHEERLAAMVGMTFLRTYGFFMMMATPYRCEISMGRAMNAGMPLQLQERANRGELVVRIGKCLSFEEAEYEFLKVRDALAKEAA